MTNKITVNFSSEYYIVKGIPERETKAVFFRTLEVGDLLQFSVELSRSNRSNGGGVHSPFIKMKRLNNKGGKHKLLQNRFFQYMDYFDIQPLRFDFYKINPNTSI